MTARDFYDAALIELNKLEAPSLLLEDFNYIINKAIQQYINLVYSKYEIDQQSTDDIRVLKASYTFENPINNCIEMPLDYLHLLNCILEFETTENKGCIKQGQTYKYPARRLTSDMYTQIMNNAYMKPSFKRPYYYINNVNTSIATPTDSDLDTEISSSTNKISTKENRISNSSKVRIEFRFGSNPLYELKSVYVDYIKSPIYIHLTQEQINSGSDTSQVLEFPDYVCYEIINVFVRLYMENVIDPRLQTNIPLNSTIVNPLYQQQQTENKNN